MIEPPQITQSPAQITAVIRLTIPREEIRNVMRPAMNEIIDVVTAQKITPAGPMFSHHLRIDPDVFDFEVGVPVPGAVSPSGRVKPGELPAATVARTIYHGGYEGLGTAWEEFDNWIVASGYVPAPDLIERYLTHPQQDLNPAYILTELVRPVMRRV